MDTVNLVINADIGVLNSIIRLTRGTKDFSSDDLGKVQTLQSTIHAISSSYPSLDSVLVYFDGFEYYYSSEDYIQPMGPDSRFAWMREVVDVSDLKVNVHIENGTAGSLLPETASIYRNLVNLANGIAVVNLNYGQLCNDLRKLQFHEGQEFYFSDGKQVLSFITPDARPDLELIFEVMKHDGNADTYDCSLGKIDYRIVRISHSDWYFIIQTPKSSLYSLRNLLMYSLMIVMAGCFFLGLSMAYVTTNRNFKSIVKIIDAFEKAERGETEDLPDAHENIYTYILYRIIKNGILRKYMSAQILEKKYTMQILELKALQYQINPHFLINTLKNIYWQEVQHQGMDSPNAQMIENLLDILGYSLAPAERSVTLRDEIMHTKSFCNILLARHEKELQIILDLPGGNPGCRMLPVDSAAFYRECILPWNTEHPESLRHHHHCHTKRRRWDRFDHFR